MSDIQAVIRIRATVDQAIKSLRDVRNAYADVGDAAVAASVRSKGAGLGPADTAASAAATAAAKQSAADILTAKRAAAAEAKRLAKEVADAERKAAADAAAEAKRLAAEKKARDKAQRDADLKAQKEANAAAYQQRALAPQLTDIVVGLSTGQSPFTVLLQQGGQLKDVFGGIGNAGRALLTIFTPLRVLFGGLAAGIGLVTFEAIKGHQESDALNKSLALTGNVAGTSAGQLSEMAKAIASSQGASIASVRETLAALVAGGNNTSTSLSATAKAVTALQKITGQSSEDALKQFADQSQGVSAWAAKSNQSYNFLTVAQFKYIRSLEAQGRTQEAMRVTNEALANTLTQRAVPAVGSLERGWTKLGNALADVLDKFKSIGRDTTIEDKIADLDRQIANAEASRGSRGGRRNSTIDAIVEPLKAAREAAKEVQTLAQRSAQARADANEKSQKDIEKAGLAHQSAIAALTLAGAQRQLAITLAGLDAEQAAIELAHDKGLTGERDYALALNAIEQKRLLAQAANLEKQIKSQSALPTSNPVEVASNAAQVKQLEAQLISVRAKIAQTVTGAIGIAEKDTLQTSQQRAAETGSIWERAFGKIRDLAAESATARAALINDPVQRATAEARAAVAGLEQELADLKRDLAKQLIPGMPEGDRAQLEQQLAQLGAAGDAAVKERVRTGLFASYKQQLSELHDKLSLEEQAIDTDVENSAITTEDAEKRKIDARAGSLVQLRRIRDLMAQIAQTPDEQNAVKAEDESQKKLAQTTTQLGKTARDAARDGFAQLFNDIATGSRTALQAFGDLVGGIARAALNLISKRLGESIANSLFPSGSGGGFFSAVGSFLGIGAGVLHDGGIAGAVGGLARSVSPLLFNYAPRYHTEGIAGLRPREVPAILMEGEEVLREDNPRHIKNFKGSKGGGLNPTIGVSVNVSGAEGSSSQQQAAGEDLGQMIKDAALDVVETWATKQSRAGGILAGRP